MRTEFTYNYITMKQNTTTRSDMSFTRGHPDKDKKNLKQLVEIIYKILK